MSCAQVLLAEALLLLTCVCFVSTSYNSQLGYRWREPRARAEPGYHFVEIVLLLENGRKMEFFVSRCVAQRFLQLLDLHRLVICREEKEA
jgi:hypothetical protein